MTWADDAVAAIAPWWTPDHETYIRAVMVMTEQVELFADDQDDGTPGWSIMLDPDACPVYGLPYLAQWVGERLAAGITELDARTQIKAMPNQWRGTPYSIVRAAQRWLTGPRYVQVRERSRLDGTADPDAVSVQTFASQTPNPDLVAAELRTVIPADIVLDYRTTEGSIWENIETAYADWAAVESALPTWAEVAGLEAGFISWE